MLTLAQSFHFHIPATRNRIKHQETMRLKCRARYLAGNTPQLQVEEHRDTELSDHAIHERVAVGTLRQPPTLLSHRIMQRHSSARMADGQVVNQET